MCLASYGEHQPAFSGAKFDAHGCCTRHPSVRLCTISESGQWRVVRKTCPNCFRTGKNLNIHADIHHSHHQTRPHGVPHEPLMERPSLKNHVPIEHAHMTSHRARTNARKGMSLSNPGWHDYISKDKSTSLRIHSSSPVQGDTKRNASKMSGYNRRPVQPDKRKHGGEITTRAFFATKQGKAVKDVSECTRAVRPQKHKQLHAIATRASSPTEQRKAANKVPECVEQPLPAEKRKQEVVVVTASSPAKEDRRRTEKRTKIRVKQSETKNKSASEQDRESKMTPPVKLPFDEDGFCIRHSHIQLAEKLPSGKWQALVPICPKCAPHSLDRLAREHPDIISISSKDTDSSDSTAEETKKSSSSKKSYESRRSCTSTGTKSSRRSTKSSDSRLSCSSKKYFESLQSTKTSVDSLDSKQCHGSIESRKSRFSLPFRKTSKKESSTKGRFALPFDSETGCCHHHPRVKLAKKKQTGGWIIVQDVCNLCQDPSS